jgi:hypothetical protein
MIATQLKNFPLLVVYDLTYLSWNDNAPKIAPFGLKAELWADVASPIGGCLPAPLVI